jgi:hypothetical protein
MISRIAMCLALAVACLATVHAARAQTGGATVLVTPPPRVDPGDANWDPQRNLMEAQQYDRLLETNPAFRMARIRKECGPITDPQLRADCIASKGARPNHVGVVIARHKRAGRIEQRDGKLYATQSGSRRYCPTRLMSP